MTHHAIKRDDIVRRLPDIHLPDVELPSAISKLEWPKLALPSVDVGKAARGAAAAAHIGRRRHRSRWPLAIGAFIVGALTSWAILRNDDLRARLTNAGSAVRHRIAALRANRYNQEEFDRDDPIAFKVAETTPVEGSAFGVGSRSPTDDPSGLGATNDERLPA